MNNQGHAVLRCAHSGQLVLIPKGAYPMEPGPTLDVHPFIEGIKNVPTTVVHIPGMWAMARGPMEVGDFEFEPYRLTVIGKITSVGHTIAGDDTQGAILFDLSFAAQEKPGIEELLEARIIDV